MIFAKSEWRLIRHPGKPGAWNMAVDEAILEAVGAGHVLPTLRFYAWDPPCLSLGFAQPVEDADQQALVDLGWEIVRRPTGGRAILHTDEITYSVVGPESDSRLTGGVLASYHCLSAALLDGLRRIGLPAEAVGEPDSARTQPVGNIMNPVCFEVPSNYEITIDGKKLIGSAQRRSKDGVLQHGSLPLCGDLSRIVKALRFPDESARHDAADRLLSRATTIEAAFGRSITWRQAADALEAAFAESLNLELVAGELSEAELSRAEELAGQKYFKSDLE